MMQAIKKLLGPKTLLFIGIAYTLFISVLMLVPVTGISKEIWFIDKVAHISVFAILTLIWLSFVLYQSDTSKTNVLWVLLFALIYGIVIEILQGLLIESRTADGWDVIADIAGILLGWLIFQRIKKYLS